MTETTDTTETTQPTEDTPADGEQTTESNDEKLVPISRVRGIEQEAARWKAEALEARKAEEARAKEREERERAKLEEQGEYQKILEQRDSKIAELEAAIAQRDEDSRRRSMDDTLREAGFAHAATRKGLVLDYLDLDADSRPDFAEWAEAQAKDEANALLVGAASPPVAGTSPGSVASRPTAADLNTRLASRDLTVRTAAMREALEQQRRG